MIILVLYRYAYIDVYKYAHILSHKDKHYVSMVTRVPFSAADNRRVSHWRSKFKFPYKSTKIKTDVGIIMIAFIW